MTLAEFLLQRIAEDEEAARAAFGAQWVRKYRQRPEPPFSIERYAIASPVEFMGEELGTQVLAFTEDDTAGSKALVEHAVRWDPARVLVECRVKRETVERHRRQTMQACQLCWPFRCDLYRMTLPYAHHPHFNPAWALD
jgi:hypothetical protein